jgi:hypothetical protein
MIISPFSTLLGVLLCASVRAQAVKEDIYISVILPFAPLGFSSVIFGNVPAIQTSYVLQKYLDKLNADPNILPNATLKLEFLDSTGDGYGGMLFNLLTLSFNCCRKYR